MKIIVKHTGLLVLSLIFFFSFPTINAQTSTQDFIYVKVEVKGLACPFCAYGLEKKLKELKGVETIKIDVKEGLAYLTTLTSQKPTKETLEKIVTDAGFTPSNIIFSKKLFILKGDD